VFDDRCEAVLSGSERVKRKIREECQGVWINVSMKDDSGVKVNILKGDNIGECEKRILCKYVSKSE